MQDKWNLFIKEFIEYGGYQMVLDGLRVTVLIAVCGLLIGILIGTIIAITKVVPQYKFVARFFSRISDIYVGVFRGTPIVVQLLIVYYVLLPAMHVNVINPATVAIIVFGMNSGAYVSEIMRSGINSVDKGQMEAGRALGLGYAVTMLKIVIPQAVKNILPTLGNEFITLIKETSVLSFITVYDLYTALGAIGSKNYDKVMPYLFMAAIYIVLVLIITFMIKGLEKVMAKSDRKKAGI